VSRLRSNPIRFAFLVVTVVLQGVLAPAFCLAEAPTGSQEQPAAPFKGDPYLLETDPVSGGPLGPVETQVVVDHEGRELRFASQAVADAFKADPGKYLPAVDAKMMAQQLPLYPLDACLVSGEKLGGSMGAPIDFIHKNRLVRFCCQSCKPEFLKDPAKFIAKLDQAVIAKQKPGYPLAQCVVSGKKLGGGMGAPVDVVVGNRLVRFCCKACQKDFRKDPLKYLGMLEAESKPGQAGEHGQEHGHGEEHGETHEHPKGGGR
jgi:YHS domain-containing protein